MRLLVAGGGTGGHLFPGLALGEEVKTRHPRNDVLFVGSARGIEAREVPKAGFPLELIDVGPLKRVGPLDFIKGLFRLPRALWQSMKILRKFDPDVVVGVGGFSSGPVVLAAWLMRIPIAVQEQNALAGFTNKALGRIADAIFIAFDEARAGFPSSRTHLLGNPIRRAFLDNYLHTKAPDEWLSILVTGGSQGAHVLNLRVAEAMEILAPQIGSRLKLVHQTGVKDRDEIAARYQNLSARGLQAEAVAFIDDMSRAYARADVLVCRAGATTIADITVC
jgi:UDP-N-acetylglucosamine--N-acetylmuramyl-(pentapeptide) pyrophosphoryl-undecaprenol N-acetylglucosamine transferase